MTLNLKAVGVTATNPIRYIKRVNPPVPLASFLFLSDSLEHAVRNVVTGGEDATVVGAPSVDVAATFTDGNYIDTGIQESADMTLIGVVQRNNAQVMFMGSDLNGDANFIRLYTNGSSPRKPVFSSKWSASAGVAVSADAGWPVSPLEYEVVFGIVNTSTGKNILYIPRIGELIEAACTGSRTPSDRSIILGPGPSPQSIYSGDTVRFKAAGVAQSALTVEQCDTLYEWIRKRVPGV
ncbi:hypothetical protein K9B35_14280 [Sphingomonas sp. R647]|uniref:hypothetical protein n=1 Tax=Sphingomonas sp. R647 TaxID=2875233 RepID=UPI001CD225BB|nr:hypothetical protein [Sphingomonas sp. R647]MCA1199141.1 hypothetical protein [Sphingomonas sp. R647]